MKVFPLPSYCVNPCCDGFSSPAYCYHRFMIGKAEYPVCARSAALYNLRKLPAPPKQPKQLVLTFGLYEKSKEVL